MPDRKSPQPEIKPEPGSVEDLFDLYTTVAAPEEITPEAEAKISKIEKSKEQILAEQILAQKIKDEMRAVDSSIDAERQEVQKIFGALETGRIEKRKGGKGISHPEKATEKLREDFFRIKTKSPTIDDLFKVFVSSGFEIGGLQDWLQSAKSEIQSLSSERESVTVKIDETTNQLTQEEQKNVIAKLFRKKARQAMAGQLKELKSQAEKLDITLAEKQTRFYKLEFDMPPLVAEREALAFRAVEQLFRDALEKYHQLKERLASPDVLRVLNDDLIEQRLLPGLEELRQQGTLTEAEIKEYLDILRMQFAEGTQWTWNDPIEKKEVMNARRERLRELYEKSHMTLRENAMGVTHVSQEVPNSYYDRIFDFVFKEFAREKLAGLKEAVGAPLNQEQQARIGEIVPEKLCWGPRAEALDLRQSPITDFDKLSGLERWKIAKKFAESSGLIPQEVFERVEEVIIQRSCNEQLFPGGYESWSGTGAAIRMGDLGNPTALPLMLRHIEVSGSGHTNNAVVYVMQRLLKDSEPEALQKVLATLPKNKRLLLQALADEKAYINRFGEYGSHYNTCHLLQKGDLTIAQEQLTRILEDEGTFDEKQLRNFYSVSGEAEPQILEALLKARNRVESVIIQSKLDVWKQSADKFLAASVNPRYGDSTSFPRRVVQEGLGVSDEKTLAAVDRILTSKTFKGSSFDREAFLDGLIFLNSKDNGKEVLETILHAYRGAKDDPKRMRRVLQLLSILDGFGEYEFVAPSPDEINRLQQEIGSLQDQFAQVRGKAERKKIKDTIEARQEQLRNLTGLKGIVEALTQRVVEAACRRLELPPEYQRKISDNIDEFLKSGLFEIVPTLASGYDAKGESDVKSLLRTITMHIVEGDFSSWRYSHEKSELQLSGLDEQQKELWKTDLEPVTIEIELSEVDESRRVDELRAAQEIVRNAKEHILDSQPNFDFSKARVEALNAQVYELTERIKSSASDEEKKRLAQEKGVLRAEALLINGILEIEGATPKSYSKDRVLAQARELRTRILELNIPLAGLDLEQIEKIFTVGDIKSITAYEADDPLTLLKVGVEPQETCQSWRSGGFNECLLAYVADSNKKVLNVADSEGRVVARSIIKLTDQIDEGDVDLKTKRKTLLVERPYSLLPNVEVYRVFIRALLRRAQGLGASITFGRGFDADRLKLFAEEAQASGYAMNEKRLDVFIPLSLNKYEYSDTLGGKISWFGRYQPLNAVTFEQVKRS